MTWKNYTYENSDLDKTLQRIDGKKNQLDKLRPLPAVAVNKIKESLAIEWTYNSNAIEGNTLTLRETQMVIEEGITVKGKSLREHFEAVNHQEAIAFIEELAHAKYVLDATDVLSLHALILQKIEKDFAGMYRNMGVRITGANFVSPNAAKVDSYMDELIEWVNENSGLHLLVKTAIFHHRFVWIHPFFDGNGRTARLLMNLLLMKEGYPPAVILKNDRKKYYDALNKANNGDYSKLLLLVLQAAERSLDIYLGNFANTYDQYQPITDIVNERDVPYGQEYISLLARQGKIDAFKEGRNWLTTKEAVINYMEKRERKRKV
ncbi:Fic family protein [Haoranjiania flava]|uniref:Fic family protein n=1 Tax=Haoranjiania flava TaxID=1856322 RepID=A0AAE3LKN0_9BACT|nr:Fic family protein [Haoranjiania flava]MCU7694544.1 Fic family protein [Haoranjiania flava]